MALVFGVMRIVYITHGDLVILLALIGISLSGWLGSGPVPVLCMLVPLAGFIGSGPALLALPYWHCVGPRRWKGKRSPVDWPTGFASIWRFIPVSTTVPLPRLSAACRMSWCIR